MLQHVSFADEPLPSACRRGPQFPSPQAQVRLGRRRRRVPLSTDKVAAHHMLPALEREPELVRRGVLSKVEASVGKHQAPPLDKHFEDYVAYLEANGACKEHRSERDRQLRRIAKECG